MFEKITPMRVFIEYFYYTCFYKSSSVTRNNFDVSARAKYTKAHL